MTPEHFDVLVVGAGLSGIGAGYHLQTRAPKKTYAILEARDAIGGTWDLFRYPGVRSDSDMYTLGYAFRPWREAKAIADGPDILNYVRDTARENRIDTHVRFRHRVVRASWSNANALWTVEVMRGGDETPVRFTCGFLFGCSGYYDYAAGYTPEFPGIERFAGVLVHPQKWPTELDWTGKRVVVGLRPKTPQNGAGTRIDPPMSEPTSRAPRSPYRRPPPPPLRRMRRRAIATGRKGSWCGHRSRLSLCQSAARTGGTLVLPMIDRPGGFQASARSAASSVARCGPCAWGRPQVVGIALDVQRLSLTVIGTPSRGRCSRYPWPGGDSTGGSARAVESRGRRRHLIEQAPLGRWMIRPPTLNTWSAQERRWSRRSRAAGVEGVRRHGSPVTELVPRRRARGGDEGVGVGQPARHLDRIEILQLGEAHPFGPRHVGGRLGRPVSTSAA